MTRRRVIVGAGAAGVSAAMELRNLGIYDAITLADVDPTVAYERFPSPRSPRTMGPHHDTCQLVRVRNRRRWRSADVVAGNGIEPGRSVASKLTAILMTFTEGTEHSLTDIARRTRLPISTAHRLTAELTALRVLDRVPDGRYRAGLSLRRISMRPDRVPHVAERGAHVLDDLAAVTGRRARLGVLHDNEVSYIERPPGRRSSATIMSSAKLPIHPTALGRALLAFSPPPVVDMVITRGLRRYTAHTVTAPDRFRRALAIVRITRVAVTRFELEASTCGMAVPVFGPGGAIVAAIELTIPDLAGSLKAARAALTIAARSLSRELADGIVAAAVLSAERPGTLFDELPRRLVRGGLAADDHVTPSQALEVF